LNLKISNRILIIITVITACWLLFMAAGCDDDNPVTSVPEFAYEGVWEDYFDAVVIMNYVIADSIGPPIFKEEKAEYDTTIITPMKSVLTIESDFFDVRIFKDDTELVSHSSGYFTCSADTLTFTADGGGVYVFGNMLYARDSLYIFDFVWSDTTGPICFSSNQNFLLWDCGDYNMIQESRGVFHRIDD